jgi:hypothetical protein
LCDKYVLPVKEWELGMKKLGIRVIGYPKAGVFVEL